HDRTAGPGLPRVGRPGARSALRHDPARWLRLPERGAVKPLSRRAVLRGLGGTAIALPWLEAMVGRKAEAATVPPRLVMVFSANGTLFDRFAPATDAAGNITAFKPMLAPLDPFKSKLLVLGG